MLKSNLLDQPGVDESLEIDNLRIAAICRLPVGPSA
jgi:hypothetical protein